MITIEGDVYDEIKRGLMDIMERIDETRNCGLAKKNG